MCFAINSTNFFIKLYLRYLAFNVKVCSVSHNCVDFTNASFVANHLRIGRLDRQATQVEGLNFTHAF